MTVGDYPLNNKIVVVTGGGSGMLLPKILRTELTILGLSFEFVKLAVAQHNKVIIADINLRPEAEEFLKTPEGTKNAIFQHCDVAKRSELDKLVPLSESKFGDVPEVYIAGAGVFERVSPLDVSRRRSVSDFEQPELSWFEDNIEGHDLLMAVNASHPIHLSRIAMRAALQNNKKAVVCVVASMTAMYPLYPSPVYNASKHAAIGFVKGMKSADIEENVKIVAICPG
jgi:NAD(P)-dependent dehydrogenase (short-subunit alcohol dehydrogenase family)